MKQSSVGLRSRVSICASLTIQSTERVWHLLQIAIPLPRGLPYALRRSAMDLLRAQIAVQHRLQDCFHQHIRIHRLPDAQRLQTNP